MAYVDVKKLYKDNIAVYCRVSTAGQNINQQINLAEIYLSKNNIELTNVTYFLDNSISANKLSVDKRPELTKLLKEIRDGKVRTVIVQSRDRLARNFYEYIELVKEFYKYDVNVEFTDSGQVKFSNELISEGLYGMLAQSEGRNIARRNYSAAQRFPNSILGFNVIGKKREKKYVPKLEMVDKIKTIFFAVINATTAEELIGLMITHKKEFKDYTKFLACLGNPFYAGYLIDQDTYLRLEHVEPIISLEVYLKAQESLLMFEEQLQASVNKVTEKGIIHPICSFCKTPMNIRNNEELNGYYVCAKNGHPRITITIKQFNSLISKQVEDVLKRLNSNGLKKDVFAQLLIREKELKLNYNYVEKQLKVNNDDLFNLIGTSKKEKIDALIEQANVLEESQRQLHSKLILIEKVRLEINNFVNKVKTQVEDELLKYEKPFLIKQLFSKIEVNSEAIIYHTIFGKYILGDEKVYDYQA